MKKIYLLAVILLTSFFSVHAQQYGNLTVFSEDGDKFFLILNMAMGGTYAGEFIDPTLNQAQLHVDYIRFYSVNGVGKVIKG